MVFGRVVKVGTVGRVRNGVEGRGGNVALGNVGSEGNVGNIVILGKDRIVGTGSAGGGASASVFKRWRATWLLLMLESDNTAVKENEGKLG